MHYILGVAVVNGLEELLHVGGGLNLAKVIVLGYLVKKGFAFRQLHHQVDESRVIVGFEVLDDVWVIKLIKQSYLMINLIKILVELFFVHDFDGDFEVFFKEVVRCVDLAELP